MGALIMLGLRPGPSMLSENLDMTFSFVWMIAFASVIATVILLFTVEQVAKVALLPGHLVVPGVLLFVYMGAWLGGSSLGDWISCTAFGVLGFAMKRGGWPRPPVILALVLGSILEGYFQISMRVHQGVGWLTRPIVLVLIVVIIITLIFAARSIARQKKSAKPAAGEGSARNHALSLLLSTGLCVLFIWAGVTSLQWPPPVRQPPLLVAIPGAILAFIVAVRDLIHLLAEKKTEGSWQLTLRKAYAEAWLAKAIPFFGYLIGIIVVTIVAGQKIALPLFIGVYLWRWGGYRKRFTFAYALAGWLIVVFFYGEVMNMFFHPSYLQLWLETALPDGVPAAWLIV